MTELAREKKLATQLGAQRHTLENMHRVVELIQAGAIGPVREVHAWIGGDRGMPEVPDGHPARAGAPEVGPVAGPGRGAALSSDLLPVRLAVLVGLRHRRDRQLGLPHPGHRRSGPWA